MAERLQELNGNYRFLIPSESNGLVIGTPTDVNNPNHQEIAEALGLEPKTFLGGYVEIWEQGQKMAYCGGAFSVPEASNDDFERARQRGITIFSREKTK